MLHYEKVFCSKQTVGCVNKECLAIASLATLSNNSYASVQYLFYQWIAWREIPGIERQDLSAPQPPGWSHSPKPRARRSRYCEQSRYACPTSLRRRYSGSTKLIVSTVGWLTLNGLRYLLVGRCGLSLSIEKSPKTPHAQSEGANRLTVARTGLPPANRR